MKHIHCRVIAMVLCGVMVLGICPSGAVAAMVQERTPVSAPANEPACTCATETDIHAEDCPLYAAPLSTEPACTCATETDIHAEDCPLYAAPLSTEPACTCATETDAHAEDCPLYVAPEILALRKCIDALPSLQEVLAMAQDSEEFGRVFSALGEIDTLLAALTDGITEEEATARKEKVGAAYMEKYQGLCAVFLRVSDVQTYGTDDSELREHMLTTIDYYIDESDSWEQYLHERLNHATTDLTLRWNGDTGVADDWKWSGAQADKTAMTAIGLPSTPDQIPYFDTPTKTYYVYSGEQLLYALKQCSANTGYALAIMADIDLNGQAGGDRNWPGVDLENPTVIDGGNHTIYNLRADRKYSKVSRTAFIGTAFELQLSNLKFDHANVVGKSGNGSQGGHVGVVLGQIQPKGQTTSSLTNVHVTNSLVVGGDQVGALWGRLSHQTSTSTERTRAIITGCSVRDSVFFGRDHVGSLGGTVVNGELAYCFSIGCTIVSAGGHSGGLVSCGGDIGAYACFVDAEVHGKTKIGVFTGAVNGQDVFRSCYSSGFVEGREMLGGFVGQIETPTSDFYDCYSTALVGLRSNSNRLGGFVGDTNDSVSNGGKGAFLNCYAAGEVGYVGVDVSAPTAGVGRADKIGGFAGGYGSGILGRIQFGYCYYDKQATGMREWDYGGLPLSNALCGAKGQLNGNLTIDPTEPGLAGVLTTDSTKAGSGLMTTSPTLTINAAGDGYIGFGGFKAGDAVDKTYTDAGLTNYGWDYSEEGHYPELAVFKNASVADWGTSANLVKAYSLASTCGVQLDTWEKELDTESGRFTAPLNEADPAYLARYCTVRDLTSGFGLTSGSNAGWGKVGTADGDHPEGNGVNIGENNSPVLSLKNERNRWFCDELVPGIEWLEVTCRVGDAVATNRLRIIPTAGLEAGKSVAVTDKYDHADDVELYFSTGTRLEQDLNDITIGIFPDMEGKANALTQRQLKLLSGQSDIDFSATNDRYTAVDAAFMSDGTDNAENGKLYTYIYKVTGIDAATNQVLTGDRVDLTQAENAAQFNGYMPLTNENERYLVAYLWQLSDGRVIQDAKLVRRARIPFQVDLNLYRNNVAEADKYPTGGNLYVGVAGTEKPILDAFAGFADKAVQAAADQGAAPFKKNAQAAWQLKNEADTLESITVTVKVSDSESYSRTITNPTDGQKLDIECIEYRIVYEDGAYYTIPECVNRTYTLHFDATNSVWYLNFDKAGESPTGRPDLFQFDMESDMIVDVVLAVPAVPETGSLSVAKTVTGTGGSLTQAFEFSVTLADKTVSGIFADMEFEAGVAIFSLKSGESVTAEGLPAGTEYQVAETRANQDGYTTTCTGARGTVTTGSTSAAAFVNHKMETGGGAADDVSVSVTKVWNGGDNHSDSVTVQLYQDGNAHREPVTLNAGNNWGYTWQALSDGHTYTVDEVSQHPGYRKTIAGSVESGFVITNNYQANRENPDTGTPAQLHGAWAGGLLSGMLLLSFIRKRKPGRAT